MTLPYKRGFEIGRGSEQFLNDDFHLIYEALKNINYRKNENRGAEPSAKVDGALWFDKPDEELMYYDQESLNWKTVFGKKFQITDQILNVTIPSSPVLGQLWIYGGVLCYFDGSQWQPIKALIQDGSQWSNAAFEDFRIVAPLDPMENIVVNNGSIVDDKRVKLFLEHDPEIGDLYINGNIVSTEVSELEYDQGTNITANIKAKNPEEQNRIQIQLDNQNVPGESEIYSLQEVYDLLRDDTHKNTNFIEPVDSKWGTSTFSEPEIEEPGSKIIPDSFRSQFIVPNLSSDRVFVECDHRRDYEQISTVCFQYPTSEVNDKTVGAVHLNPGKLTNITKRFIKVDKQNPSIDIPSRNTEYYGFRLGEIGGHWLIPSRSQDWGDYIPNAEKIILNYNAAQDYDYVLSVTYEFANFKQTGTQSVWDSDNSTTSFYLTNLTEPINVHTDGLKLEEAAYDIDYENSTITINDDAAEDIDNIQLWSPYRKQYGYIRNTDLDGNGIIRLHHKVNIPLVFVGGTLIHPLYGGLEWNGDTITVPNNSGIDSMKNLAWCVVDLHKKDKEFMYYESGEVSQDSDIDYTQEQDYLDGDNYIMHGTFGETHEENIQDYILGSGIFTGEGENTVIYYDKDQISEDDGIILFVEGLLIAEEDIIRNHEEGTITIKPEMKVGQDYVLIRDREHRLYNTTNMIPAFSIGNFDESLIYLNGRLLMNLDSITTTNDYNHELVEAGVVHNEVKYFVKEDGSGEGEYRYYDDYDYKWKEFSGDELTWIKEVTNAYSNQLMSLNINVDYTDDDLLYIYTFKFSNTISDYLRIGNLSWIEDDTDGLPVYCCGTDPYQYKKGQLNIYRNGVKLFQNEDFKELDEHNYVKLMFIPEETDRLTYVIEPIETGEDMGHETVVMGPENALQPNIYCISDTDDISTPNLYPGRVTVYINGLRLPKEDWTILDNKKIMLKYSNYIALGSSDNYPEETYPLDKTKFTITHTYPDYILVEIRKDYDRQELTFNLKPEDNFEIYVDDYGIDPGLLETKDEVLFYLNGQFLNLSRNKFKDYKLDGYKGCIAFQNETLMAALSYDPLQILFDRNSLIYGAWKKQTGKDEYVSNLPNQLTIVWR